MPHDAAAGAAAVLLDESLVEPDEDGAVLLPAVSLELVLVLDELFEEPPRLSVL